METYRVSPKELHSYISNVYQIENGTRVYIAWCKHESEFGRIQKFMQTQAMGEGLHKYFRILPN